VRKLQWDCLNNFKLIDQDVDQVPMPFNSFSQSFEAAGLKNELLQQWRNVHYATVSWLFLRDARL